MSKSTGERSTAFTPFLVCTKAGELGADIAHLAQGLDH